MDFNLYRHLSQAINWLAPYKCFGCNTPLSNTNTFCDACYLELPFQSNACIQCGQALAVNHEQCGHCMIKPPFYDQCFCPFEYQTPIKELICALKYNDKAEYAKTIGQLLSREVTQNEEALPDIIIPVPTHISKLRSRGFNQSALIAQQVSKELNIPLINDFVVKIKATPPQAKQSLINRQKSLNDCFKIKKNHSAQSVAIIDDVVTTGSTVNEISKVLKKNGVDYIQVWGVAHTL